MGLNPQDIKFIPFTFKSFGKNCDKVLDSIVLCQQSNKNNCLWSITAAKANENETTRKCVNKILQAGYYMKDTKKNGKWKLYIDSIHPNKRDMTDLLMNAAEDGLLELTALSLNCGASTTTPEMNIYLQRPKKTIWESAASGGNLRLLKYVYDKFEAHLPENGLILIAAAEKGRLPVVEYLINKFQYTYPNNAQALNRALFVASCYGRLKVVMFLIDKFRYGNADVNGSLIGAAYSGQLKIVKYLVMNGADIRDKIKGQSALTNAAPEGHLAVVKYLVETAKRQRKPYSKDLIEKAIVLAKSERLKPKNVITYLESLLH